MENINELDIKARKINKKHEFVSQVKEVLDYLLESLEKEYEEVFRNIRELRDK